MSQQLSVKPGETCTAEPFLRLATSRPRENRRQLIDGAPVLTMRPPAETPRKSAAKLDRKLTAALDAARRGPDVLWEIGSAVGACPDFRPVADLAIVPAKGGNIRFFRDVSRAAEILSPATNTQEHVGPKRRRCAGGPNGLDALIVSQDNTVMEVCSRSNNWRGRIIRSPDNTILLPEFGGSRRFGDLHRDTPIR